MFAGIFKFLVKCLWSCQHVFIQFVSILSWSSRPCYGMDLDVVCQHNSCSCSWYPCTNHMYQSFLAREQVCVHFNGWWCSFAQRLGQPQGLGAVMGAHWTCPPPGSKLFKFKLIVVLGQKYWRMIWNWDLGHPPFWENTGYII